MTLRSISSSHRMGCVAAAFALWATAGWAADNVVLVQGDKFSVTALDIEADAVRLPAEMRDAVLAKPPTVAQIATNLYVRRGMAQKAEAQGLGQDPAVVAALQVARDKVLSDALLTKIETDSIPNDAALEAAARESFRVAKPDKFQTPEQLRLRHILIAGSSAESRTQAEKLLEEMKGGADFAQLARERSADKGSGARGGDLGLVPRGRMVPEFEQAAFALQKPNELSGVVETKFGFHVVQLLERQPARQRTFDEVKPELVAEVRKNLQQKARVAEAERLQRDMKLNTGAIEAFSAAHVKAP